MPNNDTKNTRAGSPAGGYCLQRTRRRLARLLWALFYLAIGLGAGALFISELLADKSGWDYMDYIVLAVSGGLCLGGLAAAVYEGYTNLRDFLFPAEKPPGPVHPFTASLSRSGFGRQGIVCHGGR